MQESLELAEHATKVMGTMDEAIRALDSLDALLEYLEAVGASHRRIPNFQREHFQVLWYTWHVQAIYKMVIW